MKNNFKKNFAFDNRMKNLIKQAGWSFFFKIIAMGCNFLLVPLTLGYLGMEKYGIWMTLLTILSWLSFFDFGLGNGMRNKIIIALAKKDHNAVREYISSTYLSIGLIMFLFIILLIGIMPFLNYQSIFNTITIDNEQLGLLTIGVFVFMSINFVISLINQVASAYQQAALTVVNQLIGNILAFITTYIVIKNTEDNLLLISVAYVSSLIMSNLCVSCYFYIKNTNLMPSVKFFKWFRIKELSSLSIRFFIIQFFGLILFVKDNIIITQVLGPEFVTPYNIVFKFFNIILFAHGILFTPLLSALGDAYACGDFKWIKNCMKKMQYIVLFLSIIVIILCVFLPNILLIWIGDKANHIESSLIFLVGLYTILFIWNNNYSVFLNATGKLNLSIGVASVSVLVNIPLAIYFGKLYGLNGIILSTICCMLIGTIIAPIQYRIIMKENVLSKDSWLFKVFCK